MEARVLLTIDDGGEEVRLVAMRSGDVEVEMVTGLDALGLRVWQPCAKLGVEKAARALGVVARDLARRLG